MGCVCATDLASEKLQNLHIIYITWYGVPGKQKRRKPTIDIASVEK
jgi:hypothetical protein